MPEVLNPEQAARRICGHEADLADMDAEALTMRRLLFIVCCTQLMSLGVIVVMVLT